MDKNADLIFNISTTSQQYTASNIRFSTQDEGTAKLTFFLFKDGVELPLSAVTGKIVMKMADGSKYLDTVTIVDRIKGIAEFKLNQEQLKHYGMVIAELYLNYEQGQKMSVHRFSFIINQALIDSDIPVLTEYYIDDFESLKKSILKMASEIEENVENAKVLAEDVILSITENNVVKATEFEQSNDVFQAQLENIDATKADQSFVDAQLAAIVSGAPTATFSTLVALKTAYPNGTNGVFLVLADGHWYYWNNVNSSWTDGGLYQSTQLADNYVTYEKMKNPLGKILHENSIVIDFKNNLISLTRDLHVFNESQFLKYIGASTTLSIPTGIMGSSDFDAIFNMDFFNDSKSSM